jgi:hypothetical protein
MTPTTILKGRGAALRRGLLCSIIFRQFREVSSVLANGIGLQLYQRAFILLKIPLAST